MTERIQPYYVFPCPNQEAAEALAEGAPEGTLIEENDGFWFVLTPMENVAVRETGTADTP